MNNQVSKISKYAFQLPFKLFILATGFFVFQFLYCEILEETCDGIWNVIQLEYVKTPSTKEEWKGISTSFSTSGISRMAHFHNE